MPNVTQLDLRSIAIYLPQFHPIAENDLWWGRGFTEWTNVTKARPLFPHHQQPHLPADLGFYDIRLPEVREAQAALARDYGISGFCYYHYWFNGRRILQRPFDEVLGSGEPDFPFCLAWANENWTRIWDGGAREVLLRQQYSLSDDRDHIRSLLPAFADSRYIHVQGRPLFLVYKASALLDPRRTTDVWREELHKAEMPDPFLVRMESDARECGDPASLGFDAALRFQPRWCALANKNPLPVRVGRRFAPTGALAIRLHLYRTLVKSELSAPQPQHLTIPCVMPGWDNTARRRRGGTVFHGSTPALFESWLTGTLQNYSGRLNEHGLVFINAWNEWAEGNHLEPDRRWGRAYLEAHLRAITAYKSRFAAESVES